MNRAEFMSRLTAALSGLPMEERQAALKYYEEYFEEAGPEREQEILAELGEPMQVAKSIWQDYSAVPATPEQAAAEQVAAQEAAAQWPGAAATAAPGEEAQSAGTQTAGAGPTTTGTADFADAAKQVRRTFSGARDYAERLRLPVWLWVVIAVFALPVLFSIFGVIMGAVGGVLGVVMGLFGAVIGLLAGAFGLFFAVGIGGMAMVVGGVSSMVAGVIRFVFDPASGMLAIGIGALLASTGVVLCVLGWWLIKTVLPKLWGLLAAACREIRDIVRRQIGKGGNKE